MSNVRIRVHINEILADIRDIRRFRIAPSDSMPKKMFLNCHYCGYAPDDDVPVNGVCPKCRGSSWDRFALSKRLVPAHML